MRDGTSGLPLNAEYHTWFLPRLVKTSDYNRRAVRPRRQYGAKSKAKRKAKR